MKKLLITTIMLMQFFTVALYAQRNQATPHKVQFDKLSDYVNDNDKRRTGERLIINGVLPVKKISYEKVNKMYFFQPVENGGNANDFLTSAVLAKSMRPYLQTNTTSMRVTCTLIEFFGEMDIDVLRSPFVTKVEGLNEKGEVIWTATGTAPAKLKYPQ